MSPPGKLGGVAQIGKRVEFIAATAGARISGGVEFGHQLVGEPLPELGVGRILGDVVQLVGVHAEIVELFRRPLGERVLPAAGTGQMPLVDRL